MLALNPSGRERETCVGRECYMAGIVRQDYEIFKIFEDNPVNRTNPVILSRAFTGRFRGSFSPAQRESRATFAATPRDCWRVSRPRKAPRLLRQVCQSPALPLEFRPASAPSRGANRAR